MDNITTYVKTNMSRFSEKAFSEVDSLVLSWLSYMFIPDELFPENECISIRDLFKAEYFETMVDGVNAPDKTIELLTAVVASPRYRDIMLKGYKHVFDPATNTQFAAITFELHPELHYIAFRGTDLTLVGWKEDFTLSLQDPVQSQKLSVSYLNFMASQLPGPFFVGGHSKGGHMAVYASAFAEPEYQDRILRVYSHDGPGFLPEDLEQPGFARINGKIMKTIPQSSLVGMFFEQECEYKIIHSRAISLAQHNPFFWEIKDNDFCYKEDLTPDAKLAYKSMNSWIKQLSQEERRDFIEGVFEILEETGIDSFDELDDHLIKNTVAMVRKFKSFDKEKREFIAKTLGKLARNALPFKKPEKTDADLTAGLEPVEQPAVEDKRSLISEAGDKASDLLDKLGDTIPPVLPLV